VKGGVFNHFLQIKYMNNVAKGLNRRLLVVPLTGRAADRESDDYVNICEVFNFTSSSSSVSCSSDPALVPLRCFSKLEPLARFAHLSKLCFDGRVW
jgi:hypothetical protein